VQVVTTVSMHSSSSSPGYVYAPTGHGRRNHRHPDRVNDILRRRSTYREWHENICLLRKPRKYISIFVEDMKGIKPIDILPFDSSFCILSSYLLRSQTRRLS